MYRCISVLINQTGPPGHQCYQFPIACHLLLAQVIYFCLIPLDDAIQREEILQQETVHAKDVFQN